MHFTPICQNYYERTKNYEASCEHYINTFIVIETPKNLMYFIIISKSNPADHASFIWGRLSMSYMLLFVNDSGKKKKIET